MKKTFSSLVVLLLVSCMALFLLASCTGDNNGSESFEIPDSYTLSMDIYNNGSFLGSITQSALQQNLQEVFTMNISNSKGDKYSYKFVAYKIESLLSACQLPIPEFANVKAIADDYSINSASLSKAYLAIGEVKDAHLEIGEDYPMLIFDKDSAFGNVMLKNVTELEFNPNINATGVEDCDYDIDDIQAFDLKIYQADTLLGTITKDTLAELTQQTFTMVVIKNGTTSTYQFVAYKMTAILRALDIKLTQIDGLKACATDGYSTAFSSIEKCYLAVAEIQNEQMVVTNSCPMLILDKDATTNSMISKNFDKLIINPID